MHSKMERYVEYLNLKLCMAVNLKQQRLSYELRSLLRLTIAKLAMHCATEMRFADVNILDGRWMRGGCAVDGRRTEEHGWVVDGRWIGAGWVMDGQWIGSG